MTGITLNLDDKTVQAAVDAHISAVIAEAMNKDPEKMLQRVVNSALGAKVNTYDRETIFQKSVKQMLQGAAKEAFLGWIEEHKPTILAAIQQKLGGVDPSDFANKIADRLVESLSENFYASVSVRLPIADD